MGNRPYGVATERPLERIREAERQAAKAKIQSWLDEGNIVGVFECKALDSVHAGTRFALPFDRAHDHDLVLGKTRAPDTTTFGMGWKFLLELKTTDAEIATAAIFDQHQAIEASLQTIAQGA